jgi:hypothetical protein
MSEVSPQPEIENVSFMEGFRNVRESLSDSWHASSAYGKSLLFLSATTQAYERFRIPEIIAPPLAVNVYLETGSAAKTALTLGGLVGVQQLVIGQTWAETLAQHENVAKVIGDNFPKTVELAEDIGPSKNRKWYSSIREGASGFGTFGTTPFVISKKMYEPESTRKELHKTAARVTGSIALAGVFFGKAAVEIIEELPPEQQVDVVDILEKPYFWIGLAALWELPRFIKKRVNRRQQKNGRK